MGDLRDHQSLGVAIGKNKGSKAVVLGRNADGHYRIAITHDKWTPGASPADGKWHEVRLLGSWWPAAAVAGEVQQLPLVSCKEDFCLICLMSLDLADPPTVLLAGWWALHGL